MRRPLLLLVFALFSSLAACAGVQRHGRTPNALSLDGALGNRFVPAGARSTLVARLRLATAPADPAVRPPINVGLVIDTSGSMEGRPIDDARSASLALVDAMRDGDRLAIVTFDSRAEVIFPSAVLDGGQRAEARRRIGTMRARGTTDMASGLRLGIQQVAEHLNAGGINRVVLLGDGVPNTDPAAIEAMAASAGAHQIAITSLGLGLEYNESLMGAIARRSGGHFHYVEDSAAVATAFRTEVLRMERVIARNAVVTLNPGPDVQIEAVLGHDAARTDAGVTVQLGEITEGATRDLIVRLNVPSHRAGSPVELVDARLAWNDPASSERHERDVFLGAHASSDAAEIEGGRSAEVEAVAAQVQLAVGTVAAIREARSGNVAAAEEQLDALLDRARASAHSQQNRAYREQIGRVSSLRRALPAARAPASAPDAVAPQAAVNTAHDEAMSVIDGY